MHLRLTLFLKNNLIRWNTHEFLLRKKVFGFDNANAFLRRIDKYSLIPILQANGAIIGENCDLESPMLFHNCTDFSNLVIGDNVHIGKNCFFDLKSKIYIQNNVVISMQTTFITHQDLNQSELHHIYPPFQKHISIHNDSYIGANATIMPNVEIGPFSIVAAGSVVLNNVDSKTLVGGIPAKLIKQLGFESR